MGMKGGREGREGRREEGREGGREGRKETEILKKKLEETCLLLDMCVWADCHPEEASSQFRF